MESRLPYLCLSEDLGFNFSQKITKLIVYRVHVTVSLLISRFLESRLPYLYLSEDLGLNFNQKITKLIVYRVQVTISLLI